MNRCRCALRAAFQPLYKFGNPLLLIVLCFLAGCISKSTADARARAAFLAGEQQQMSMMSRRAQIEGPTVTVLGEVRNELVRWTADLTLAKALVEAEYVGRTDPTSIIIQRDGKAIPCDPRMLLTGQDVPLQPNDVIELRH